ncbi:MAG: hypothetical protein N2035_08835 [Chthoniobacterales bacterium]|nr:hypothetical protein [Chthoniobacterales bacterium]
MKLWKLCGVCVDAGLCICGLGICQNGKGGLPTVRPVSLDNLGLVENSQPSCKTQRQARTSFSNIPALRGLTTDRFWPSACPDAFEL